MPLVKFNGIRVDGPVEVPDELMRELFFKAKKDDIIHFPSAYVNAEAKRLGLDWRMPALLDYLQIYII